MAVAVRVVVMAVVLSFARTTGASAQTVRGIVSDEVTGAAIALASVTLVSRGGERVATVLTTEEGFYSLDAEETGQFLVRATALGYSPSRVGPIELGDEAVHVVELRLAAAPLGIEGIVVEGARQGPIGDYLADRGFWGRLEEGRGQYLTPGQVANSDAMFTPNLLRGMKWVVPQYGASPWAVWPMLGITEARACEPHVYVDGFWMNRPEWGLRETLGLDDVVQVDRIRAVELYYGPFQAPVRYQGPDNSCGVVLIWTG